MIVVMPFGHTPKRAECAHSYLVNREFGDDLFNDLIPLIERNFRVNH